MAKRTAPPRRPSRAATTAGGPASTRRTTPAPRRRARAAPLPAMPDIEGADADEEPLVPGAPSSLVPTRTTGRTRPVSLPEDEFNTEANEGERLRAGDLDTNVGDAAATGEGAPGGENPTPDQDVVDLIGRALGVEYADDEELQGAGKIAERDRRRWELDPASAEDYLARTRR